MKKIISILLFSVLIISASAQAESRLMRFPAIHGDQLVFSYAGDLYITTVSGGIARRLTSDPGYEMFAKFSPDGKMIAFTGQYDGNTEVYIIPASGGQPRRLTYTATLGRDEVSDRMGPNNIVMTWTNDGKHIIYRSRKKTFNDFIGHLFMVSVDGGHSVQIPLSTGGFCSFSPDGKKLAFNRVFREFRTWKYYQGGMADDIRIFDYDTKKITNITNHIAQDIFPMWIGNEIFFVSDRERIANLFAYETNSGNITKVTNFTVYDVKFPSHTKDAIVFENGGYIYRFDVQSRNTRKIEVRIADDLPAGRSTQKDASKNIQQVDVSPDGERLVFSARGDVFSVPAESGITRNLTNTSGIHERNAVWSPDGKHIAYISDESGEFEVYIRTQDGSAKAQQLTKNADTYYFSLQWSPDSKYLLFNDKLMRLRYVDVSSKQITEVAKNKIWEITGFTWSPDSRWIAYTNSEPNGFSTIKLFNLAHKKTYDLTDEWYRSYNPQFSNDGKYLFFVSDRDFNPTYSRTEWNHSYSKMSRPYFITLAKETPNPLTPKNNEVNMDLKEVKDDKSKDSKDSKDKNEKVKQQVKEVKIDVENISSRILSLPVEASDYWNVSGIDKKVYYMRNNAEGKSFLYMYDFEKREEKEMTECSSFRITDNNKKMLLRKGSDYYIIDVPSAPVKLDKKVNTDNMKVWPDNKAEWNQIFYESWRQMRDFFYVPNMHGVDWNSIKEKYEVLLPYVNHRHDLNYIIGEMIGELNVGHAYVNGGDMPELKRIPMGMLGAEFSRAETGYYHIDKILKGANWSTKLRSPLTEAGVNVNEGNYIIAIDGVDLAKETDMYRLLVGKAGKQVELTVSDSPFGQNPRKTIVIPVNDESELYYYNWVQENIRKVSEATNGEVGYLHIPDMGMGGLVEFTKYFYPQLHKKALIIDDRGNGGGNVSPMIIERLQRQIQRANMARNMEIPSQTPRQMIHGPIVVLVNQYSASDGDLFPYGIKHYGIGKVIGVRTWGGVVGIRGTLPFIDGAILNRPEYASYDPVTGEWIIEGWGVEPDIVVDNDPYEEFMGIDTQLEKAIEVILEEMKTFPAIHPIPQGPDKSGKKE
jgi:tricorn protease